MKIAYRCMNEEETSKLLKKSKANCVSPAAALLASYFLAFQKIADISGKQVKFGASKSLCKKRMQEISQKIVLIL